MEFTLPDLSKFQQTDSNIFLYNIDLNISVARYMSIDEIDNLIKGSIGMTQRASFNDKLEHGIPYNPFAHCLCIAGEKPTEQDQQRWDRITHNRKTINNWFTKCFSCETKERATMWHFYGADKSGLLVEFKLANLINAIDLTTYNLNLYVGRIKYSDFITTNDLVEFSFTKESPYMDEKEVRIYLLPKSGVLKDDSINIDSKGRFYLPFKYHNSIFSKVTLAPYSNLEEKNELVRRLESLPGFNSNILRSSKIRNVKYPKLG